MQSFKEGLKYCVDRGRGCYCHGRNGYLCNSSSGEAGIILSGFVSHLASNFRAKAHILRATDYWWYSSKMFIQSAIKLEFCDDVTTDYTLGRAVRTYVCRYNS